MSSVDFSSDNNQTVDSNRINNNPDKKSVIVQHLLKPSQTNEDDSAVSGAATSDLINKVEELDRKMEVLKLKADENSKVQFFIRTMSDGKTMVIQAKLSDTVMSIHDRINFMTGIPVIEQRLIYRGKQLDRDRTLADYGVEKDVSLQMVGKMRSTEYPLACQVIDDMLSTICRLCRGEQVQSAKSVINGLISQFLATAVVTDARHIEIFTSSPVPSALVTLYVSDKAGNKEIAESSIVHLLEVIKSVTYKSVSQPCACLVYQFCDLLRKFSSDENTLYTMCRGLLAGLLEDIGLSGTDIGSVISVSDMVPFAKELGKNLCANLEKSTRMSVESLDTDVRTFFVFIIPLHKAIVDKVPGHYLPLSVPFPESGYDNIRSMVDEIDCLYYLFYELLVAMDTCLEDIDRRLEFSSFDTCPHWLLFLPTLKHLNRISKLYKGGEELFKRIMSIRRAAVSALIVRYANRFVDNRWLLEHKGVANSEASRNLVLMLLPHVKEDKDQYKILVRRSRLLLESFEYISYADPKSLRAGLSVDFKYEEATGPDVLKEWFLLVCEEIFKPQNALFAACSNDETKFFPNPASKVDPLHLEYFSFAGRVIALALMHGIQVGVGLERSFFTQLAGNEITLEDIKDADPNMYQYCKEVLQMDAADIDELDLTFVLGTGEDAVELCSNGANIAVNIENRERYVKLLIKEQLGTSVHSQIAHFKQGFADILPDRSDLELFLQSLKVEDLNLMLLGDPSIISGSDTSS